MNSVSRLRNARLCSIHTVPLRSARRRSKSVATSAAANARSRSSLPSALCQTRPSGTVQSVGNARKSRSYSPCIRCMTSSSGCAARAFHGSATSALSSARTGRTPSISRSRTISARLRLMDTLTSKLAALAGTLFMNALVMSAVGYWFALPSNTYMTAVGVAKAVATQQGLG